MSHTVCLKSKKCVCTHFGIVASLYYSSDYSLHSHPAVAHTNLAANLGSTERHEPLQLHLGKHTACIKLNLNEYSCVHHL